MDSRKVVSIIGIVALAFLAFLFVGIAFVTKKVRKPRRAAAIVNGEVIYMEDFEKRLLREFGQPVLLEQVRDILAQQEAARRGLKVADDELNAAIASWISEEIKSQQARVSKIKPSLRSEKDKFWLQLDPDSEESHARAIEFLIAPQGLTLQQFREEFRQQMMLEKMVKADLRLKNKTPSDEDIDRWFREIKRRARIRSWRSGLRPSLAAVVNGVEIPISAVVKEVRERVSREKVREILDEMIDELIVKQKLREIGEEVTEEEIDKEVERFRKQLRRFPEFAGMSLENWLRTQGQDMSDLRKMLAFRIGLAKVAARDIPEETLRRAFEKAKDIYSDKKVRASHIFIAAIDPDTGKPKAMNAFEQALKKINWIRRQALAGKDFAELARRYSDAPTARSGGDLGFFTRTGAFIEPIVATAFRLKKGEISEPIRTKNGYHILKVTEIVQGKPVRFEDCKQLVLLDYVAANRDAILKKYRSESKIETFIEGIGRE